MLKRVASPISAAARAAGIGNPPMISYEPQQAAMLSASICGIVSLNEFDPTAPRVPLEERTGTTVRDVQCS